MEDDFKYVIAYFMTPIIAILIILVCISLLGVVVEKDFKEQEKEYLATTQLIPIKQDRGFAICYDRDTKVMYSMSTSIKNYGTITLLVDKDGKPLIYEGDIQRNTTVYEIKVDGNDISIDKK